MEKPYIDNRPDDRPPYHNNRPDDRPPYHNNRPEDRPPYHNNRPFAEKPYIDNRPSIDERPEPSYPRPVNRPPPHQPTPHQPNNLDPISYRPPPTENGKQTADLNDYQLTDVDRLKLRVLESKWISLRREAIDDLNEIENKRPTASKHRTRVSDSKAGFDGYYRDYFKKRPRQSAFIKTSYFEPNSINNGRLSFNHYPNTQTLEWPPNQSLIQQPNQPFVDYVYNLYFKTMLLGERCLTPNNEAGFCRLVEDCPIRPIITDYANFLKYSCTIGKSPFVILVIKLF